MDSVLVRSMTVLVISAIVAPLIGRNPCTVNAMTAAEQQQLIDIHNALRRGEGSSNMQIMTWNPTLAIIAQNWSDACNFVHGQGVNSSTISAIGIGQNLYATYSVPPPLTINMTAAVVSWFNEKSDYSYTSNACASGKVCGHYTQVVWATSNQLGCGYTVCPTLKFATTPPSNWSNALFVVCNYAPPGNYIGQLPYKKGTSCTQCASGKFFCNNGLCDANCSAPSANCVCAAACQNCANITTDCRCKCGTGWTGVDCSVVCNDTNAYCGANPGWPASWCTPTYQYVLDACPKLCGLCVPGTPSPCVTTTPAATTASVTTTPTTTTPRTTTAAPTTTKPTTTKPATTTPKATTAAPTTTKPTTTTPKTTTKATVTTTTPPKTTTHVIVG